MVVELGEGENSGDRHHDHADHHVVHVHAAGRGAPPAAAPGDARIHAREREGEQEREEEEQQRLLVVVVDVGLVARDEVEEIHDLSTPRSVAGRR